MKIAISADSTCDLSSQLLNEYGITVLPMTVMIDGTPYRDGVDIHTDAVLLAAENGRKVTTSSVNASEYKETFKKLLKDHEAVIHIAVSSELSSSYANACAAAEKCRNVYVADSRNLSTGMGYLAILASNMARRGMNPDDIMAHLALDIPKIRTSFIIDSVDFLHRGGRCSAVAALGAKVLRFKPSILVRDGMMVVGDKYRGKLEKCLVHYMKEQLTDLEAIDPDRIFLTHSPSRPEVIAAAWKQLGSLGYFRRIAETDTGSTIVTHCGPNTVGIVYKMK